MKKLLNIMLTFVLCLTLSACVTKEQPNNKKPKPDPEVEKTMVIKPSELSDETKEILKSLNGDNTVFYDFNINDTVKFYVITTWVCKDGKWKELTKSTDDRMNDNQYRIGININEKKCDIILMGKSQQFKTSSQYDELEMKGQMSVTEKLNSPKEIQLNQEISLWYKAANEIGEMSVSEDFKSIECDEGFAITISFHDAVVEL